MARESNEFIEIKTACDEMFRRLQALRGERTPENLVALAQCARRVEELSYKLLLLGRWRGIQIINQKFIPKEGVNAELPTHPDEE